MSPDLSAFVENSEHVARILHREWIVDGVLQVNAFALSDGETYISVNRPVVETFAFDVSDFVHKHPLYMASEESDSCHLATLQVSDVRKMEVCFKEKVANLAIEVEPRDTHYKSHAGIFTRVEGKNIKGGQKADFAIGEGQVASYEDILLKVQHQLLALSTLERKELNTASAHITGNTQVLGNVLGGGRSAHSDACSGKNEGEVGGSAIVKH